MIKKLTQALLALALVGGMTACDKSMKGVDEGDTSATGDTYMSVTFTTANPSSTRVAAEDKDFNSIGEYMGRDEIKNVNVYVINLPQENIDRKTFTTVTLDPDKNADTNDFRTEAWKTTPGNKIVYVYVNIAGTEIETKLNEATSKAAIEAVNKKAFALTENGMVKTAYAKFDGGKDIIAMNSTEGVELTVTAGVKKTEAEAQTNPKNRAKVSVRRLVAQAAVTSSKETFEIKSGTTTIATLGNLKWDVMQFEKTTYLAPQPVDATANPAQDPMLAKYCKSPSFDFVTDDATHLFSSAATHYEYRAFTGEEVKTFTRNTDNKENVKAIVATPMKFITETTHQYGGKLDAGDPKTGYRKGNTTYVIVSAKITPDDAAWAEGEKAAYAAIGTDGDLFLGVQDHKFYASLDKAKAANKSASIHESDAANAPDNVIEYTKGICYYIAWLNPDTPTEPVKSPILRNNIYHVNVTAMKKLGYSGNPFNPNGDNPKDPDDPTPNPTETLYPVDTYMAVEISVVNWGVHSYDHEF